MSDNDTIAAISTAPGEGAIAVVRLSGPEALDIADRVFEGGVKSSQSESHRAFHGWLRDPKSGGAVDEVVLTVFRGPGSYTGEDVAEVSCHGGWVVPQRVLYLLLQNGARLAQPGEFTQRAFLNGKLDLAQAEAVADLIRAKTDLAQKAALSQMEGALSCEVNALREGVLGLLAEVEARLEFPEEEGVPPPDKERMAINLRALTGRLARLLATFQEGKLLREGAKVTIIGKPNVGKSSLFNALLKDSKAIVTPVPGTTRDVIEGWLSLAGLPVLLSDTAGIREPGDVVEQEGVLRSKKSIAEADLVLFVLDSSGKIEDEDLRIVSEMRSQPAIAILNKCDLPPRRLSAGQVQEATGIPVVIETSAITGFGLSTLLEAVLRLLSNSLKDHGEVFVTNARHAQAFAQAKEALDRAEEALRHSLSEEFLCQDLREALNAMGEITGQTTPEDVLALIFSSFCIGK